MGALSLLLAFHNHQPVGNFENVFREAFEKCYDPFLRFLEEHPFFRASLHYSGCLLDWIEAREKPFLKRLSRLVRKNQVELLSGGYYEPILPLIPERDAVAQIRFMNRYLQRRFRFTPKGLWLTERIWEQKLPRLVGQAGLRFTAVDDTHFALAGLGNAEIRNYFITEEEGWPLYVFPIPKELRYAIPFHEPDESFEWLRQRASEEEAPLVTYADDGEKFGLWPGTYQWVFRDGWLERFSQGLEENRSWIQLRTFSEVLEEKKGEPVPKIFLPSAAYEEMMEWSQNREKAREFSRLRRELEAGGVWNRARVFFQGGTFKNFLAKYSEADWMRCRMEGVSQRVHAMKVSSKKTQAERELWQAQCNCPYWHGVFGGLYLHHLRRSTYEHLLRAEEICRGTSSRPPFKVREEDLNRDGADELIIESPPFSFYLLPHRGGTLAELDLHPEAMNLLDTLTRREEPYHQELVAAKEEGIGPRKSIHELEKAVSPEVIERIAFDAHERFSLVDQFLPAGTSLDDFWKGRSRAGMKDPTRWRYEKAVRSTPQKVVVALTAEIPFDDSPQRMKVEKNLEIPRGSDRFSVTWKITNVSDKTLKGLWGSEWSFNFYAQRREERNVTQVEIQDGWSPVHLEIVSQSPFEFWLFPIETVAQTEKDFRLMHQGISVFPHWKLALKPGQTEHRILDFIFTSRR